jgi:hypothetical protein
MTRWLASLPLASHRVMVGQRDDIESGRGGAAHDLGGRLCAV